MVVICKTNISRSCRQQFVKTLWGIDIFFSTHLQSKHVQVHKKSFTRFQTLSEGQGRLCVCIRQAEDRCLWDDVIKRSTGSQPNG